MRKLFAAVALFGLVAVTGGAGNPMPAQDQKERSKKEDPAASLKAGLKALAQFEAKYPCLANNLNIVRAKLSLVPKVGEVDEAKKVAEAVVVKAIKQGNPSSLGQVAALLRNGPGKESKELLGVAVKAAEAAVQLAFGTHYPWRASSHE